MRNRNEIERGIIHCGVYQTSEGGKAVLETLLDIRDTLVELKEFLRTQQIVLQQTYTPYYGNVGNGLTNTPINITSTDQPKTTGDN